MKLLQFLSALALLVAFTSCGKDNVEPTPRPEQFELYIDFWNPDGDNPQIQFDSENSSPEVKIDFPFDLFFYSHNIFPIIVLMKN